jgi:hypothetical protein
MGGAPNCNFLMRMGTPSTISKASTELERQSNHVNMQQQKTNMLHFIHYPHTNHIIQEQLSGTARPARLVSARTALLWQVKETVQSGGCRR